jgi:hypothetical protein
VLAQGRVFDRARLDDALQRQRRHFEGSLYDDVSVALSKVIARMCTGQGPS